MWKLWHWLFGWHYVNLWAVYQYTSNVDMGVFRVRQSPNGRKYLKTYLGHIYLDQPDLQYNVTPLTYETWSVTVPE